MAFSEWSGDGTKLSGSASERVEGFTSVSCLITAFHFCLIAFEGGRDATNCCWDDNGLP